MDYLKNSKTEWFDLGREYHENKEYEKAVDAYNHVLKIDNKDPNVWYNLGLSLRFLGNFNDAFEAFDNALLLDPDDGKIYLQKGLVLISQEKNQLAIKNFNTALECGLKPENQVDTFVGRGISFFNLDKNEDAALNFEAALEIDDENVPALTMKAGVLLIQDHLLEAKKVIDAALKIDPVDSDALKIFELIELALAPNNGYNDE